MSVKLVSEPRPLAQSLTQRPDGGITMTNIPVATIISRAYPSAIPLDMVGLPEWARRDGYDVSALESSTASQDALIIDRFERPREN